MTQGNSGFYLLLIYVLLAIFILPLFSDKGSANDLTRWATTVSLVEKNSFDISWTKDLIGNQFADVTTEKSGARYSKKSPGIALISAPFYAITRVVIGEPTRGNVRTSWFVLRFTIASIPLILLALWLLGMEVDVYSLAVLLFATPIFPYSLLYYSHVLVAVLVYFAFRLIYDTRRVFPERCFTAGLLTGLAFICEYTALIPMVVFGLGLLLTESRDRFRRILFYVSGVAPFVFVLAIYYQLVFGSPLAVFSHHEISLPTLSGVYHLLLSPSGGLFFFSPVLLFSLVAVFDSPDRGFRRHRIKLITIFLTLLGVIFFSGNYGGASIGARQLVIIIPLMLDSFFDGEIEEYSSVLRSVFIAASFLLCTIPVLTYPFAPAALQFPHSSFWQPLLFDANFFALTMPNTFGFPITIWTILPAMILLVFALYVIWRSAKFPIKFAVGLLAGILIVGNYMLLVRTEGKTAGPIIDSVAAKRKN